MARVHAPPLVPEHIEEHAMLVDSVPMCFHLGVVDLSEPRREFSALRHGCPVTGAGTLPVFSF